MAFIDFSKAFDGSSKNALYKLLMKYDIRSKMFKVIMNMYNKMSSKVKISMGQCKRFSQIKGLIQGECMSPTFYVCYINERKNK